MAAGKPGFLPSPLALLLVSGFKNGGMLGSLAGKGNVGFCAAVAEAGVISFAASFLAEALTAAQLFAGTAQVFSRRRGLARSCVHTACYYLCTGITELGAYKKGTQY